MRAAAEKAAEITAAYDAAAKLMEDQRDDSYQNLGASEEAYNRP